MRVQNLQSDALGLVYIASKSYPLYCLTQLATLNAAKQIAAAGAEEFSSLLNEEVDNTILWWLQI